MPKVADVIAERYELLAHIGDGGTASVWKAVDRTLEREIAIKFLYVADERDADMLRKQFLREARIACAVKHRNVIQTMDFGQTEEGRAYMVMELLHGEELSQRIGSEQEPLLEDTAQVVCDVLRGLQAIHEAGIVHRDLKPENIYLERDQDGVFPKILDFGIAKSIDRRGSRRSVLTTKEGIVVGTPEYMSPEQARGQRDLDARADVWSVGVILFELLTGELPFDDPSEVEVIIKIVTTDARKVTDLQPSVPTVISQVVEKALKRERAERFQTAAEMNQALTEAVRSVTDSALPTAFAAAQRKRKTILWLSGAAAIAVLTVIVFSLREQSANKAVVAAPKALTVTVELRGVPSSGTVLVNGKPVKGTKLTLPNDGHSRLIEVQAPDRSPWRVMHPAGNDANYEVRMPIVPTAAVQVAPAVATELSGKDTTPTNTTQPAQQPSDPRGAPRVPRRPRTVANDGSPAASGRETPTPREARAPEPSTKKTDKKGPAVWRKLDF
jgi:tRNA A-37 threonylcarbamoyl transferase component Bud32